MYYPKFVTRKKFRMTYPMIHAIRQNRRVRNANSLAHHARARASCIAYDTFVRKSRGFVGRFGCALCWRARRDALPKVVAPWPVARPTDSGTESVSTCGSCPCARERWGQVRKPAPALAMGWRHNAKTRRAAFHSRRRQGAGTETCPTRSRHGSLRRSHRAGVWPYVPQSRGMRNSQSRVRLLTFAMVGGHRLY